MLGDKHKTKVISIIKMGNKIGDKRVFVPHGHHLGIQVQLGIWSSTSIESCIRKGWGIFFKGREKTSMIVRTKALVTKVHGKDVTSWFQCNKFKSSQTFIVCSIGRPQNNFYCSFLNTFNFRTLVFGQPRVPDRASIFQTGSYIRTVNYFKVLDWYGETFEKRERFKEKTTWLK